MAGIIRKIQDTGRITIPKSTMDAAQIAPGDYLEVFVEKEGTITSLVLRPASNRCLFCSEPVFSLGIDHIELKGRIVCTTCTEEIQ